MKQRLAALDSLAACLTVGKTPEQVGALEKQLNSGRISWPQVINLANENLVSPTLWAELCSHELEGILPREVQDYLGEVHRLNTVRNRRLREQTLDTVLALNGIGVTPVLLKGAISLFTKTYPDQGARMLTDIDILVPRQNAEECWNLLHSQGYSYLQHDNINGPVNHQIWHHLEPFRRPHDYAFTEIHREVLPPHASGQIFGASVTADDARTITDMVNASAQPVIAANRLINAPSPTARILHSLLHSALGESNAYRAGTLPLRSIHELALLQSLYASEIDWRNIQEIMAKDGKLRLLQAWVYLAHKIFGCTMPAGWSTTRGMKIHYTRCRLQARWGLFVTMRHFARIG